MCILLPFQLPQSSIFMLSLHRRADFVMRTTVSLGSLWVPLSHSLTGPCPLFGPIASVAGLSCDPLEPPWAAFGSPLGLSGFPRASHWDAFGFIASSLAALGHALGCPPPSSALPSARLTFSGIHGHAHGNIRGTHATCRTSPDKNTLTLIEGTPLQNCTEKKTRSFGTAVAL